MLGRILGSWFPISLGIAAFVAVIGIGNAYVNGRETIAVQKADKAHQAEVFAMEIKRKDARIKAQQDLHEAAMAGTRRIRLYAELLEGKQQSRQHFIIEQPRNEKTETIIRTECKRDYRYAW